jgi:hypothetical protein
MELSRVLPIGLGGFLSGFIGLFLGAGFFGRTFWAGFPGNWIHRQPERWIIAGYCRESLSEFPMA